MNKTTPATIDEYIAGFPADIQVILQEIRAVIHKTAPDATEAIKYQMPTFIQYGNLIHFGAYKKHIGMYPVPGGDEKLARDLAPYAGDKGTMRFPLDEPMPYPLIARVIKARLKDGRAHAKAKETAKVAAAPAPTGNIDAYIAGFPAEVQAVLQKVRAVIRQAAPTAEEAMKYGIPTFVLDGNLIHFAGFKSHIGLYPTPSGIVAFKKELAGYASSKGAVQFPLDKPIPYALIERITKFRVKENAAQAIKKK